ncbi:hypothetical protein GLP25_01210 [Photobacterium phosphoreum]|uniref:hypothetical protein n=1 Tax=Photobacterium phosphoreum TaxID=659 RepID=UPI001E2DFA4A|nr:hypothetical protein [Photobacterium phosphoreum]MCD9481806.1 hypothetical protein [Photobacterium phosphoreum]
MKRLDDNTYKAKKVSGNGFIDYYLWVSRFGEHYIQLHFNDFDTKSPGTFPECFFKITDHSNKSLSLDNICGVDKKLVKQTIRNVNTPTFLQAAINHYNDEVLSIIEK